MQGQEGSGVRAQGSEVRTNGADGVATRLHLESASSIRSPDQSRRRLPLRRAAGAGREIGRQRREVTTNAVPVINRVSAGYPKDFTDLSYPKGVADDYVGCPDVHDKDAFAARVHGDSMTPKYREGDIVIFSPAAGPKSGDDCFVRFEDGHTTFKRVFFENDDEGGRQSMLRLQPRNEKYRPQTRPGENSDGVVQGGVQVSARGRGLTPHFPTRTTQVPHCRACDNLIAQDCAFPP